MDYLRQGAERRHDPGRDQHHLRPLPAGQVDDGVEDGRETVQGDDDHDEARGIESQYSEHSLSCGGR